MRPILAALLICSSAAALADGTWLTASLGSYHVDRNDYCEINPGVGLEHGLGRDVRFITGSYQNSLCKPSSYLGASYMPLALRGGLRAGAAVIAATGYQVDRDTKRDKPVFAVLPTLAYEGRRYGVNLVLMPPFDEFKGAIGVVVKLRLK